MLKLGPPTLLGFLALSIVPLFVVFLALREGHMGNYFPRSVTHPGLRCGIRQLPHDAWSLPRYFDVLNLTDEPSLFAASQARAGRQQRSFRFAVVLSRAASASIVRLDQQPNGRMRLTAQRFSTIGSAARGGLEQTTRLLTTDEQARFERALLAARGLDLPPYSCRVNPDGGTYYYEANDRGVYHYVDRWIPPPGPLFDLGKTMYDLAGWTDRPLHPGYLIPGEDD